MTRYKPLLTTLSVFLLFLLSCQKDTDFVANMVPMVDAGAAQTITLPADTVTLAGSASDSDGHVVAYLWSQVSGPMATNIVNPGSMSTMVTGFTEGTYVFQLMVTDNEGATGVDTVSVTVQPSPMRTLTLQPANNPTEYSVTILDGADATGPTIASLEADAWTKDSNPWTLRGLVKFDLSSIPSTATIQSAHLYLYSNPAPTTGNQVDPNFGSDNSFTIQQVASDWSPSSITWFNQPAGKTDNQVVLPTADSAADLDVDVTAMVGSMVNNNANYGFLLKLQHEVTYNSRIFVSSHNATYPDKHPKLVITYKQ